jgi:hypothetical protein
MYNMRKPKTTCERRAVATATENGTVVRGSRNSNNLPNEWDDRPHSRRGRCDRHKNVRR